MNCLVPKLYFLLGIVFIVEIEKSASTSTAEVTLAGGGSPARGVEGEEGDSGIDANSQGSCSSNEVKPQVKDRRKEKKKKKPILSSVPLPETRLPIPAATSKPVVDVSLKDIFCLDIANLCRYTGCP